MISTNTATPDQIRPEPLTTKLSKQPYPETTETHSHLLSMFVYVCMLCMLHSGHVSHRIKGSE